MVYPGRNSRLPRLLLLVAVAVSKTDWAVAQCPDGTPPPCARVAVRAPSPNSVAVLLFENRARDTAMTLLAEGLADQITTNLGTVGRLDVKSTSSVRYALERGPREPVRIGRTVGARWLVDGQLLAARGDVRVSVQLVEASRGSIRWSQTFQRPTSDLFALISAVADSVATAIVGELAPAERVRLTIRPTANAHAYDLFVRARAAMQEGAGENLLVARALLEEAVRRDSAFAAAFAALASTWVSIADNILAPREAYPRARLVADRALRLDSANGEATAALAKIAMWFDWDMDGAVLLARRAVALAPGSAEARLVLGLALVGRGDPVEGSRQLLEAAVLDSLSARTLNNVLNGLLFARQSGELIARGRQAQATDRRLWGYRLEYFGLAALGRCQEARALLERAGYAWVPCAILDDAAEARIDSEAAERRHTRPYFRAWGFARYYAVIGKPDKAFAMLEQAYRDREAWMPFIGRDLYFDSLRGDPRFADLERRVAAEVGRP